MAIITQFPSVQNVVRQNPGTLTGLTFGKKVVEIHTEIMKSAHIFRITFPVIGGVRISNCNTGFFEAEDTYEIQTVEQSDCFAAFSDINRNFRIMISWGESDWKIEIYNSENNCVRTVHSSQIIYGFDEKGTLKTVKLLQKTDQKEILYGLGERFNSVHQNKSRIMLWNVDCCHPPLSLIRGGHEKKQGYKNIPLLHSSKGYTLFFNTFCARVADIREWEEDEYFFEFSGTQLDLFIWSDTIQNNIKSYLKLTGLPYLPPRWAAEYWAGGGFYVWNSDGRENAVGKVREVAERYEKAGIKIKTFYLELKPEESLFRLAKEKGFNIILWTDSVLRFDFETEFERERYTVRKKSNPTEPMTGGYVDFSNPASRDMITVKYNPLWKSGALKGVMIDYADNVYEDSIFFNGQDGGSMHNFYPYWYARRFNETWDLMLNGDFVLLQRSGCAGSQHWTAVFGGDLPATYVGLRRALTAGLSACNAGFSAWGSDIGGFCGVQPTEELYARWLEFGAFSPIMRAHGILPRDPWNFGKEAENIFLKYFWLRYSLADAVYSAMVNAALTGETVMQSLAVAFNNDAGIVTVDDEYMFCGNMLVCPVIEENSFSRKIVFPRGRWTDFWTGRVLQGMAEYMVSAPVDHIPVYLKSGTLLPVTVNSDGKMLESAADSESKALLVTCPEAACSVKIYRGTEDFDVYALSPDENGFVIENSSGSLIDTLLICGYNVERAVADDTPLPESRICFDSSAGRTVLKLERNWMKIVIS